MDGGGLTVEWSAAGSPGRRRVGFPMGRRVGCTTDFAQCSRGFRRGGKSGRKSRPRVSCSQGFRRIGKRWPRVETLRPLRTPPLPAGRDSVALPYRNGRPSGCATAHKCRSHFARTKSTICTTTATRWLCAAKVWPRVPYLHYSGRTYWQRPFLFIVPTRRDARIVP